MFAQSFEQAAEARRAPDGDARQAIAQRLIELVGWPESRIPANERHIVGDVLLPLVRTADRQLRLRCAEAISRLHDAPSRLLRYLACDEIDIARCILLEYPSFKDVDALVVVQQATPAHWRLLATRRDLTPGVCNALVETRDDATLDALLQNLDAPIAAMTLETLAGLAEQRRRLIPLLLDRPEMRPAQGLGLFWRANHQDRLRALSRFGVDRTVLSRELVDLFVRAVVEGWNDAPALHALGFLERRQRRRGRGEELTLESLVEHCHAKGAVDAEDLGSIAAICGLTPVTVEKVLFDPGGEPFAVLAKSVGLRRGPTERLWRALDADVTAPDDRSKPFGRMLYVYQTLPNAKAQTVLRYWNWSLTAAALAGAGAEGRSRIEELLAQRYRG